MSQFLSLNINKREQFQIQKQMAILILFKYEGRRKVKAFYYIIPVLTPSRSQHNTALKLVCLVPKPGFSGSSSNARLKHLENIRQVAF